MSATGVADGHMRSHCCRNPLRARHQREHQFHAAQMRDDLRVPRRIRIGNPDVDVNVMIEIAGQANQLDSRGEIGEQIGGYILGISNAKHRE